MSKNKKTVLICLVVAIFMAVIPLLIVRNSDFAGADGAAGQMIETINPNYVVWMKPILKLPGAETESFLFALQAAIGAGILSFGFGYLVARKKYQNKNMVKDYDINR